MGRLGAKLGRFLKSTKNKRKWGFGAKIPFWCFLNIGKPPNFFNQKKLLDQEKNKNFENPFRQGKPKAGGFFFQKVRKKQNNTNPKFFFLGKIKWGLLLLKMGGFFGQFGGFFLWNPI